MVCPRSHPYCDDSIGSVADEIHPPAYPRFIITTTSALHHHHHHLFTPSCGYHHHLYSISITTICLLHHHQNRTTSTPSSSSPVSTPLHCYTTHSHLMKHHTPSIITTTLIVSRILEHPPHYAKSVQRDKSGCH